MKTVLSTVWLQPVCPPDIVDQLERDAASHPHWADVQNRWGACLLAGGRFSEAVVAFDHCLELHPRYGWAGVNLAAALALAGRFDAARDALQAASDPATGARVVTEGWIAALEGRGSAEDAIRKRLHHGMHRRPDVLWLLAALGETADVRGGLERWSRVLQDPHISSWHDEVAELRTRRAETAVRGGLFPGIHQLWLAASRIQAARGELAEAQRSARMSFLFWSDRGRYLNHQGRLAALRGASDEAAAFHQRALEEAPDDPDAPTALAQYWSERGDLERAAHHLALALDRAPGYADLHRRLGRIEAARGRAEQSVRCFERALEINPLFSVVRLELADTLFRLERWRDAESAYDRALASGLRSPAVLVRLGQCLEHLDRADKAESAYRDAAAMDDDEPMAYYRLGLLLRNQGRRDEARNAWERFLQLSAENGMEEQTDFDVLLDGGPEDRRGEAA